MKKRVEEAFTFLLVVACIFLCVTCANLISCVRLLKFFLFLFSFSSRIYTKLAPVFIIV